MMKVLMVNKVILFEKYLINLENQPYNSIDKDSCVKINLQYYNKEQFLMNPVWFPWERALRSLLLVSSRLCHTVFFPSVDFALYPFVVITLLWRVLWVLLANHGTWVDLGNAQHISQWNVYRRYLELWQLYVLQRLE